ncbi:MAG: hemolysin family protein [Anaerolineae bacterium]
MSSTVLQIGLILILIVINGVFAMAEIAVVSARRGRLQQLADHGNHGARTALELANDPNQFLSTIQIGITLIGVLTGALSGATIADDVGSLVALIGPLAPYSQVIGLVLTVLVTTYLSLVIGELVPKRLALDRADRLAVSVAPSMRSLARLAAPAVWLLSASTDVVMHALGIRDYAQPPVTEEEIQVLVDQGTVAGVFEEAERDMVERVFRLGDRSVGSLMRPRTELEWIDIETSPEHILGILRESNYSRFPVGRGSIDEIIGIVQVKDLLGQCVAGEPLDIQGNLIEPLFVPESMRVLQVLEQFRQVGQQLALVVDEYGLIEGLVTLNDVLEAIVGEIPQHDEEEEPLATQRDDGSWLMDGLLPVVELKDLLDVEEELPGEGEFQTLGGFVTSWLGRIPSVADHFEWGGLRFEIVDMDGHRVDKVLVSMSPPPNGSTDAAK